MNTDKHGFFGNERNVLKGRHSAAARISPFQGLVFFVLATQGWRPGLSYFALSGLDLGPVNFSPNLELLTFSSVSIRVDLWLFLFLLSAP